jgi:segregation and condensation protein B
VLRGRTGRLPQAALETLAIVAYKQPVTRAQVSEIRGVEADGAIRSLVSRGLVEEVGRDPGPGQPLLYGTTTRLLEQLGLDSLDALPPLPSLSPDGPLPPEPDPGGYKAARRQLDALGAADDKDDDLLAELDEAAEEDEGDPPGAAGS